LISSLKEEPDWMLDFRYNAFERFLKMKEPRWSYNQYPIIDFQGIYICYYSAPKKKPPLNSLEEADRNLLSIWIDWGFLRLKGLDWLMLLFMLFS
jgi:Fe-S cluster assembly scaffold protein SufB